MIYGLNFNGVKIPDNLIKRFGQRKTFLSCPVCRQYSLATKNEPKTCVACTHTFDPFTDEGGVFCEVCCQTEEGHPVIVVRERLIGWLSGVATDVASKDAMLIQANNGHRLLFVVERADTFGIFTY